MNANSTAVILCSFTPAEGPQFDGLDVLEEDIRTEFYPTYFQDDEEFAWEILIEESLLELPHIAVPVDYLLQINIESVLEVCEVSFAGSQIPKPKLNPAAFIPLSPAPPIPEPIVELNWLGHLVVDLESIAYNLDTALRAGHKQTVRACELAAAGVFKTTFRINRTYTRIINKWQSDPWLRFHFIATCLSIFVIFPMALLASIWADRGKVSANTPPNKDTTTEAFAIPHQHPFEEILKTSPIGIVNKNDGYQATISRTEKGYFVTERMWSGILHTYDIAIIKAQRKDSTEEAREEYVQESELRLPPEREAPTHTLLFLEPIRYRTTPQTTLNDWARTKETFVPKKGWWSIVYRGEHYPLRGKLLGENKRTSGACWLNVFIPGTTQTRRFLVDVEIRAVEATLGIGVTNRILTEAGVRQPEPLSLLAQSIKVYSNEPCGPKNTSRNCLSAAALAKEIAKQKAMESRNKRQATTEPNKEESTEIIPKR